MDVAKVGIVGLGRWAKVLTRAAAKSSELKIVSAYSRTEDKRQAFAREFGVAAVGDLATMLADPTIKGVILTVPNEQHLPLSRVAERAGNLAVPEDLRHVSELAQNRHLQDREPIRHQHAVKHDRLRQRRWRLRALLQVIG